ncbi:MBL fold metallo-hydrolase [Maridesulfovibrio zosterae]|uniref:MBL fold metallo-hydrolase n=1 Tax=Maridesulfovibrio zosterae TaxID=82171 RepID=UPI000685E5D2|nr:ribonuclease Z [Maridesulfovibrio zosterae]
MRCTFIGVGSAFDETQTNTSLFIEAGGNSLLLDCGFNAAHNFVKLAENPHKLDSVWISHFHGDHFFGIPFLLGYLASVGRVDELAICGPHGIQEKVCLLVNLAYPNLLSRLPFKIVFYVFSEHDNQIVAGFDLSTCIIDHSEYALAVRVQSEGRSLFYSGDGKLVESCMSLAQHADFAVLEAYKFKDSIKGHSSVISCLKFVDVAKISRVALVHLEPFMRTCKLAEVAEAAKLFTSFKVILPEENQYVDI